MLANLASLRPLLGVRSETMLASRGWGEDGTEFSPFASVLGTAGAERCQAGQPLPALAQSARKLSLMHAVMDSPLRTVSSAYERRANRVGHTFP
jgi:hypothetical protein